MEEERNPRQLSGKMGGLAQARGFFHDVQAPLKEVWVNKVYYLFLFTFLKTLGVMVLVPYTTTLLTDYFSEKHAGHPVQCTDLPAGVEPPAACKDAHDDVIQWNAVKSFTCHIFLNLILTPTLSRWSDYYGRKPFLLYGSITAIFPTFMVFAYAKFGLPLWWYYPAQIINDGFSSSVVGYSYITDVISPAHRTMVFGLASTPFAVAMLLGPMPTVLGIMDSPLAAASTGLLLIVLGLLVLVFLVKESLPENSRQAALEAAKARPTGWRYAAVNAAKDFWMAVKILFRTPFFRKMTFCVIITYMMFEEVMNIEYQYLQEVAGFGTKDQANMQMMTGVVALLIQSIGLWFITSVLNMTNKQILTFGLAAYACKMVLLAVCKTKAVGYGAFFVGTFVFLTFPAIASIKSQYVADSEQGAVQGALGSAQSLAMGIGPIGFSLLFYFSRHGSIYFPGLPFWIGFVLMVIAAVVAATIYLPPLCSDLRLSRRTKPEDDERAVLLIEKDEPNL